LNTRIATPPSGRNAENAENAEKVGESFLVIPSAFSAFLSVLVI